MIGRPLPFHNGVDGNDDRHANLAPSMEKWDDSARRPGLAAVMHTVIPSTNPNQYEDDPFFARVPKGPAALQAPNRLPLSTPRGPASKGFADTARGRRASGPTWPFNDVELEDGREPSETAKNSPHLLVTLHDLLKDRPAWWQLTLLINFHNFLMSSRHCVGPITKYYLSPESVYVFSDWAVLENVDLVCRKELLFRQYRMDTERPEKPLRDITPMKDSSSRSWKQEKTPDSTHVSSLTPPPPSAPEERSWLSNLLNPSESDQPFSTTPPYSPTAPTLTLISEIASRKASEITPFGSDFVTYDMSALSPPNPASEISSIRSIKELQCAKCKGAATGVDPFVRCSRCKRRYHDSCRNLMNLSTTQGSIWNCQRCATKHLGKILKSDKPSNLLDKTLNGALTRPSPAGSVSATSVNGNPSTLNGFTNKPTPTARGSNFTAPRSQPMDIKVDLNEGNSQRPSSLGGDSDICKDLSEADGDLAALTSTQMFVTNDPPTEMPAGGFRMQGGQLQSKENAKVTQIPLDASNLPSPNFGHRDLSTKPPDHDRHPSVRTLVDDPLLNDKFDMVLDSFDFADLKLDVEDNREDHALAVYYFEKIATKDPALSPWNFVSSQYNPKVWDLKLLGALAELVGCFSDACTEALDTDRMLVHLSQYLRSREGNEETSSTVQTSFLTASDVLRVISAENMRKKEQDEGSAMQSPKTEPQGRLTIRKCVICKTKQLIGAASACSSCSQQDRQQSEVVPSLQPSSTATAPEEHKRAQSDALEWMFKKNPHRDQIRKVVTKRQNHDKGGDDGNSQSAPSSDHAVINRDGSIIRPGPIKDNINTISPPATASVVNAQVDSVTYVSPYANNSSGEMQLHLATLSPIRASSIDQQRDQVEASSNPLQAEIPRFTTTPIALKPRVEDDDEDILPDNGVNPTPSTPDNFQGSISPLKARVNHIKRGVPSTTARSLTNPSDLVVAVEAPDEAAIAAKTPSASQVTNSPWRPSYRTLISLALNREPKRKTAREIADWIIQNIPDALSVREESVWVSSVSAVCSMACSSSRPYLRKLETPGPTRRCTYHLNTGFDLELYESQFRQNIKPNSGGDIIAGILSPQRTTSSLSMETQKTPKGIKRPADNSESQENQRPRRKARRSSASASAMKKSLSIRPIAGVGAGFRTELMVKSPSQSQLDERPGTRLIINIGQSTVETTPSTERSSSNVPGSKTGAADHAGLFKLSTSPGLTDEDTDMPDRLPFSDDEEGQMSDVDVVPIDQEDMHAKEWEDPLDVLFEPMRQDELDLLSFLKTDPVMAKPNYGIKDLFAVHPELRPKPEAEFDGVPEKPRRLRRKEIIGTPYRNPAREFFVVTERTYDPLEEEASSEQMSPPKRTRPSPSKKSRYEWDLHAHNTNLSEADLYDSISSSARIKCSSLEEAAEIPRIAVMDLDAKGNLIFRDGEQIVSRIGYTARLAGC
jgi:hypothetical protein